MRTLFGVVGLLCLALSIWLAARRIRVRWFGVAVTGRVVDHEKREIDESPTYLPIVAFRDIHGHEHRFTSVAGGSSRSPSQGSDVPVRYLPSDPTVAYVATFLHMWAAPLALAALGVAGIAALWGD